MLLVEAVHILLTRQADLASGIVFPSVSPGPAAGAAAEEAAAQSKPETSRWSVDIAEMTFDSEPPHPLEQIFSRLEHEEELRSKRSTWSSASSLSGVPLGWEREPEKPKQQQNYDYPVLNPPPLLSSYARVGSTGRSLYASSSFSKLDFRRRSFSGALRRFVRGRLLSSDSLKFRLSPSASLKKSPSCSSTKVYDHENIPKQQQPKMADLDLCSPKAVFDGPGGSSSESATSNVTPSHNSMPENMPFPASFSPTESPLDDSFSTVPLSHAVPDSPKAVDEITSPPSTYRQDDNYEYDSDVSPDGLAWRTPPFRSKSSGISAAPDPPLVNKETLFHSKSLSQFQKTSNKSFLSSTSSSEFSIALSGRLSTGMNMNSSRYLDLDFRDAWKEATAGDTSTYRQPTQDKVSGSQREKRLAYDVKADIKNRVKEVVRKTDERTFTFSPVASSFLFSKSQSHNKNMQIFSGNLDADYIDMKLSDRSDWAQRENTSKPQRGRQRRLLFPFCCCLRG